MSTEHTKKTGINGVGVILILTLVLGTIVLGLAVFLTLYYIRSYDDGFSLTLSKAEDDETTIISGEDNVITPDNVELEFTYKDLQDYEMWANPVSKLPATGTAKILVIPIEIPGYELTETQKESTRDDLEDVFFGEASDTYWESLSSYYYKSSFEQLNIEGDVAPWYDATLAGLTSANRLSTATEYDNALEASMYDISVMDLITSALNYYVDELRLNVSDYDADGDGYIDGLWVVYSAPDYQKDRRLSSSVYWAYTTWWYQKTGSNIDTSPYSVYSWASIYMIYYGLDDSDTLNSFSFTNSSNQLDAHTIIHETGHMLGLNDYYDYASNSAPVGFNDMMDYNVCDHNMYTKMVLGWVKPYIVIGDAEIALASNQIKNSLIVVLNADSTALKSNGGGKYTFNPFNEYMLVEYYVPEGLNELDSTTIYTNNAMGITGEGFKLFHIDNRLYVVSYIYGDEDYDYELTEYTNQSFSRLFYFISNSTSGSYAEEETLERYFMRLASGETMSNYFAEISLISADLFNNTYNYQTAYMTQEGSTIIGHTASTYDLFNSRAVFNMTTYGRYFIYGDENRLNNGDLFLSNIIFE